MVSGRLADASGKYWPITIVGYAVQMASVPALALTGSWPAAAVLIILERIGKAIRNPPRDVMLSYAGKRLGGLGWVFGLHEALDQFGAMSGPLLIAAILAHRGSYQEAFGVPAIPAAINLSFVLVARLAYPRPEDLDGVPRATEGHSLPRVLWIYLAGAALVAAGLADYPLLAYHFGRAHTVTGEWVPIFYSVAMAISGTGSLVFGRLFDRYGFGVLVVLTAVSALYAPLTFFGGFWLALIGAAIWGLSMGVHELIIPAAVTPMVPANRRAFAFGLFTAGYGFSWFLGSSAIGFLYDHSASAAVVFCVATTVVAVPVFVAVSRLPGRWTGKQSLSVEQ